MPICVGIKQDGKRCNNKSYKNKDRCKIHQDMITRYGKHKIERDELTHFHSYELKYVVTQANAHFKTIFNTLLWYNNRRANQIFNIYKTIPTDITRFQQNELDTLNARHLNENNENNLDVNTINITRNIRRVPYPADLDAELRTIAEQLQRQQQLEQLQLEQLQQRRQQQQQPNNIVLGELGVLANDKQNIHTTRVVNETKATIDKVLKIPVPAEYCTDTLKTIGEIILECKLSKKGAWQMTSKYCADEVIYEYPAGIYARLLNSVWQYIKGSPDKEELKKILKSEMEDNVGMCAQGNLSRLCNILSGYLDGLVFETSGEKLQRLMAELYEQNISSDEKVIAGKKILTTLMVDRDSWNAWLEALL